MTAREKAIEAATRACLTVKVSGLNEVDRVIVERSVEAAAPHIESALLDRIEEAVKEKRDVAQRLREAAGKGSLVDWTEATRMDTLDSVLAILTEIREEGKP